MDSYRCYCVAGKLCDFCIVKAWESAKLKGSRTPVDITSFGDNVTSFALVDNTEEIIVSLTTRTISYDDYSAATERLIVEERKREEWHRAMAHSRGSGRNDFDLYDREYRRTRLSDAVSQEILKGYQLQAGYRHEDHRYWFRYRGQEFFVDDAQIMWDRYPMQMLVKILHEEMARINKEEGFSWEPSSDKLSQDELLTALEGLVRGSD